MQRPHAHQARQNTLKDLANCVRRPVPKFAWDLFSELGGKSGGVAPFGHGYSTSISAMVETMDVQLLANRFFRVALSLDDFEDVPYDLYLDLDQSDGQDAPLLLIAETWSGDPPPHRGHSLITESVYNVFKEFELHHRNFIGYAAEMLDVEQGTTETGVRWQRYADGVGQIAQSLGISATFTPRRDLACYSGSTVSVIFDAIGPSLRWPGRQIKLWIGTKDRNSFAIASEQFRANLPSLSLLREWRAARAHGPDPLGKLGVAAGAKFGLRSAQAREFVGK